MRYTTAYYLLLLYAVAVCKPIVPYVQDLFAHVFAETHHIATVHATLGSDHAHVALDEKTEKDAPSKVSVKTYDQVSVHDHFVLGTKRTQFTLDEQLYLFYNSLTLSLPFSVNYRPPRAWIIS